MVKDEILFIFIFIALLDFASSLYLSQSSVTMESGKSLVISCRDKGGQPVMWKGPKGTLTANTKPKIQDTSIGKLLMFTPTRVQDTGNYTCSLITNKNDNSIFSLIVEDTDTTINTETTTLDTPHTRPTHSRNRKPPVTEEPIEFKDTADVQRGIAGENFTVRCEVNKPYKINWLVEDGKDKMGKKYFIIGDGLLIVNVSREDNRIFICEALKSTTGQVIDKKIRFIAEHKPLPIQIPRDTDEAAGDLPVYAQDDEVYGFVGENVNLTCEVEAEPSPRFEWKSAKQGQKKIGRILNVSSHKSVLQLKMTEDTSDKYQCTASNKYGKLKKFFNLQIGTRPEPPGKVEVKKAEAHSVELTVGIPEADEESIVNGMEPKWLNIFYRVEATEGWDAQEFNISLDTFTLTELNASTKYEIVAATKNVAGLSSLSNITYVETTASSVQLAKPTFFSVALINTLILLTSRLA